MVIFENYTFSNYTFYLPENTQDHTVHPRFGKIDYLADIGDYLFTAKSSNAKGSTFYRSGKVTINNLSGDFEISLTTDSDSDLPWGSFDVLGSGENRAELTYYKDGPVLSCNKINNMVVKGYNKEMLLSETPVVATFSAAYSSVKFKAVDKNTLGVYVDRDADGTYETIIAKSFLTEKETEIRARTEIPAEIQPGLKPLAERDYGIMPWISSCLVLVLMAAALHMLLKKRGNISPAL